MHVDDCVEGLIRIMASDYGDPLNLGRDELISVDGLYDLVASIAGKKITKFHDTSKPEGVRGRNADCTRLQQTVGWVPGIDLRSGLERTYPWIAEQVKKAKVVEEIDQHG
jgi:nucleoside-diphosphate-sugar epimerase